MPKFLLFVLLFCSFQSSAQNLSGVWEGRLNKHEDGDKSMRVRLELLQSEGSWFGILYTRGVEKGTVYGCDYFVTGSPVNGRIDFKWQKVQRAISIKESDCQALQLILLEYKQRDSSFLLQGNWVWQNGNTEVMSCVKVTDTISFAANDEIDEYITALYKQYERSGILLPAQERFIQNEFSLDIDQQDIVVEFSTVDSSSHDSVSVFINGNTIVELQNLLEKPIRLRLKDLPVGTNDLLIVSRSVWQKKLNIKMTIHTPEKTHMLYLSPGFVRNALVLFNRKGE